MADPRVARQSADILLKWMARALRGALMQRFSLDLPDIVEALPTELPVLEVRVEAVDFVFLLADGRILHLEFQMVRRADDLARFHGYAAVLYRLHRRKIVTVVFYGPSVREAPEVLDGGAFVYRVRNVFLGHLRSEDVLARLQRTAAGGATFSAVDRADLILLALMAHERPLADVLRAAVKLAPALPEEERTATLGAMIGMAYNKLGDAVAGELLEEPEMANVLEEMLERGYVSGYTQGVAEGNAKGMAEGKAEGVTEGKVAGKREVARALIELRFGSLSAALEQQIATADETGLDTLVARAATVNRVEDL